LMQRVQRTLWLSHIFTRNNLPCTSTKSTKPSLFISLRLCARPPPSLMEISKNPELPRS
jgi:hypothetical protein